MRQKYCQMFIYFSIKMAKEQLYAIADTLPIEMDADGSLKWSHHMKPTAEEISKRISKRITDKHIKAQVEAIATIPYPEFKMEPQRPKDATYTLSDLGERIRYFIDTYYDDLPKKGDMAERKLALTYGDFWVLVTIDPNPHWEIRIPMLSAWTKFPDGTFPPEMQELVNRWYGEPVEITWHFNEQNGIFTVTCRHEVKLSISLEP
ncbi:MAG: hypothetical protein GY706_06125 [Bacteroides sp.]|nr:hypothetical protein [Bacteroides sp.]